MVSTPAIRTPDQRLRVFVSSTLQVIPDGYEDSEDIFIAACDMLGTMRGAIRSARATLGARGKCAPAIAAVYDAAVNAALGSSGGR